MTARYAPAAFLAALLHAAVIAVLVWFALAARNEPDVTPRLSGPVFVMVNPSAAPAQVPERAVHVAIPPMPVRAPVREEPEAPVPVVKNERPVERSRELVKPSTSPTRVAVTPPRQVKPSTNPPRTTPPPVAPVRVDTKWGDTSSAAIRSETPPVARDASLEQSVPEIEAYFAELRERMKAALQVPPGLRPELVAKVEFVLKADGTLMRPRIVAPSGSAEFDRAVIEAILRTRMRARPDGKTETLMFPFATELRNAR